MRHANSFNCGHVGPSSLIRDETQAPCIGSAKSQSLDHQGCPRTTFFFFLRSLFKNQNWSKETRGTIKAPERTTDVSLLLIESGLFIEKPFPYKHNFLQLLRGEITPFSRVLQAASPGDGWQLRNSLALSKFSPSLRVIKELPGFSSPKEV